MSDAVPIALQARYVFPVAGAPLAGGVVTLCGERIVAVGEKSSVRPAIDLGNVAILPGLVNAHTHLEFSDLAAPLGEAGESLPTWIRRVVAYRRARPEGAAALAIAQGLVESLHGGITTIGEISTGSWPPAHNVPESRVSGEAVVFHESIGLAAAAVEGNLVAAARHIADVRGVWRQANLLPGLSPHAPYSVHPELLDSLVRLAIGQHVPVAMHVAESCEELELLATGRGPFRELLEEFGVWQDGVFGSRRPLGVLEQLARCQRSLVIHGNYLAADEIAFLGENAARMSVVYCPRTHAFFCHAAYPLIALLAAGAQVALGTDSRASNPDLSLWADMQHVAARFPTISPRQVLELGTLAGARALGQGAQFGSLEAGKLANLAIVPLPEHAASDPHELLLASEAGPTQTWWHGRRVSE